MNSSVFFESKQHQGRNCLMVILFSMGFISCGKVYNSSSADKAKYDVSVAGSTSFLNARAVLSNQCFTCHSDFAAFSEADYVSSGRVVIGNLAGSTLYTKIRGNEVGGAANMPPSSTLTTQELDLIKTWINGN